MIFFPVSFIFTHTHTHTYTCSVPEFASSEERALLEQLIDAVSQSDDETVAQCCDNGIFKSMDPEVQLVT